VGYLTKELSSTTVASTACREGPPRPPAPGWSTSNVSVTPYTYTEEFVGDHSVLSRDNLKISFAVHTVWRVDDQRIPLFMDRYNTTVTNGDTEKSPDAIVRVAYAHFVRELPSHRICCASTCDATD
jgi:hypothetical protein